MITQKFNLYSVKEYFRTANRKAFTFAKARRKLKRIIERKNEIVESLGEYKSPVWGSISFIALGVCVVLSFIEANNLRTALGAGLNSLTASAIPDWLLIACGTALSFLNVLLGHVVHESIHLNPVGKKKLSGKGWIAIAISVLMCALQIYMCSSIAGVDDADIKGQVHSMMAFIFFIFLIEWATGFLFFKVAWTYMCKYASSIREWMTTKVMNKAARQCSENWDNYIAALDNYNAQKDVDHVNQEELSEYVKAAILYYQSGAIEFGSENDLSDIASPANS